MCEDMSNRSKGMHKSHDTNGWTGQISFLMVLLYFRKPSPSPFMQIIIYDCMADGRAGIKVAAHGRPCSIHSLAPCPSNPVRSSYPKACPHHRWPKGFWMRRRRKNQIHSNSKNAHTQAKADTKHVRNGLLWTWFFYSISAIVGEFNARAFPRRNSVQPPLELLPV